MALAHLPRTSHAHHTHIVRRNLSKLDKLRGCCPVVAAYNGERCVSQTEQQFNTTNPTFQRTLTLNLENATSVTLKVFDKKSGGAPLLDKYQVGALTLDVPNILNRSAAGGVVVVVPCVIWCHAFVCGGVVPRW